MSEELLHLSEHETLRVIHETAEQLEVEGTWLPGGSPPPPHLHPNQDEYFEVRTGRLTAVVAGTTRQLNPGETLRIPKGTAHKMWNPATETATATWRTRPAGRTADWFRTVDRLSAAGTRKPRLPALANAVTEYSDVFRLAPRPKPVRPFIRLALRAIALAER
jgi:mannose-6-phosphate isomerase-like protein (cupin superfamily)